MAQSVNAHSTAQVSLFGNMGNKPEAGAWVQGREGQSTLNKDVSSSLEYDGDAFLPSGMSSPSSVSSTLMASST